MTVLSDATTPEGREISVEVTPPPGSYAPTIDARSQDGVHGISVNGKNVPEAVSGSPASVRVVAFSPERSLPVTISTPAGADVELAMSCYILGLQGSPATNLHPRPADLTTGVHELADSVLVTTVTRLPDSTG